MCPGPAEEAEDLPGGGDGEDSVTSMSKTSEAFRSSSSQSTKYPVSTGKKLSPVDTCWIGSQLSGPASNTGVPARGASSHGRLISGATVASLTDVPGGAHTAHTARARGPRLWPIGGC